MAGQGLNGHHTMTTKSVATVEVTAKDLEGPGVVFCPNPKMALWSTHPRIFIDVVSTGEGKCPYCGTVYRLKAGEKIHAH
jgi:uncharacterized Zn-finger protein